MDMAASSGSFADAYDSKETSANHFFLNCHKDSSSETDGGDPPTLHMTGETPFSANRPVKRREIEPRRLCGKENVDEYLLQFELMARCNGWNNDEKSSALLCALDSSARGILSEFENPTVASYSQVKQALLRRFGPTQIVEVHKQTLAQLRLQKGQSIRELAQEVQRLVKQAYPDILGPPRECLAVKHLINAVHDKDTVFYIREKA